MEQKQKRYIIKSRRRGLYFLFYLYIIVMLMGLFSVASYTWFSISRVPRVKDMQMYITSESGLELAAAPDSEIWTTHLDFWDTKELSKFLDSNGKIRAFPTIRQITWSDQDGCFYAPIYGYDGRLIKFLDDYPDEFAYFMKWHPLNDTSDANKESSLEGYYMKATVYARSGQSTDVTLASTEMERDTQHTMGSGTYVLGSSYTGRGPEVAVRFGFRMTRVDSGGNPLPGEEVSPMYIYEPNIDRHVDGSRNDISTESINVGENGEALLLAAEDRMIRQKYSKKIYTDGFLKESEEVPADFKEIHIGEFLSNPTLFHVDPGEIIRIEIYFWLEGQDVDCSNLMKSDTTESNSPRDENQEGEETALEYNIRANIQFSGTGGQSQSGMEKIDP